MRLLSVGVALACVLCSFQKAFCQTTPIDTAVQSATTAKASTDQAVTDQAAATKSAAKAQTDATKALADIQAAKTAAAQTPAGTTPAVPAPAPAKVKEANGTMVTAYIKLCDDPNPIIQKNAIAQLGVLAGLPDSSQAATKKLLSLCAQNFSINDTANVTSPLAFYAVDALYAAKGACTPILASQLTAGTSRSNMLVFTYEATTIQIVNEVLITGILQTLCEGLVNSKGGLTIPDDKLVARIFEVQGLGVQSGSLVVKTGAVFNLNQLAGKLKLQPNDFDLFIKLLTAEKSNIGLCAATLKVLAAQKAVPSNPDELSKAYLALVPVSPSIVNEPLRLALVDAMTALQNALAASGGLTATVAAASPQAGGSSPTSPANQVATSPAAPAIPFFATDIVSATSGLTSLNVQSASQGPTSRVSPAERRIPMKTGAAIPQNQQAGRRTPGNTSLLGPAWTPSSIAAATKSGAIGATVPALPPAIPPVQNP